MDCLVCFFINSLLSLRVNTEDGCLTVKVNITTTLHNSHTVILRKVMKQWLTAIKRLTLMPRPLEFRFNLSPLHDCPKKTHKSCQLGLRLTTHNSIIWDCLLYIGWLLQRKLMLLQTKINHPFCFIETSFSQYDWCKICTNKLTYHAWRAALLFENHEQYP